MELTGRVAWLRSPPPRVRRVLRGIGALALCVATLAVVTLPLAVERGLENTVVRDTIGVVPATLTVTGTSNSRLELGILGSLTLPLSRGPFGINAAVDGPPATVSGSESVASYFSPELVEVYSGLFHDPGTATQGYVDLVLAEFRREVLKASLLFSLTGGALLLLLLRVLDPTLRDRLHHHRLVAAGTVLPAAFVLCAGVAWFEFRQWPGSQDPPRAAYSLPSLDGTDVEGAVTDSAVLRLAIEDAIPKIQRLIDRQDSRTTGYVASAMQQLEEQSLFMVGPEENEVAIMMQSDMHCNAAMTVLQRRVVELLNEKYGEGTVSLMAITGDLTTNGTAAEGACIRDQAAVADGAPVVAVAGNHESRLSADQMAGAGMTVLDGSTTEVAGTTVLGRNDPARTELFGPTRLRGEATQRSVGEELYEKALEDRPELVLVHEGYSVEAFLGDEVRDVRRFLDEAGSPTDRYEDGIRDLPASAVFYGHWHRDVPPRVVWNSDGTWTLVMELNTSGGAIATPTLNHFSTPWSQPQQLASFPLLFKNRETGLITGYQLYNFEPDGTVRIDPPVPVGPPDAVAPVPTETDAGEGADEAGAAPADDEPQP